VAKGYWSNLFTFKGYRFFQVTLLAIGKVKCLLTGMANTARFALLHISHGKLAYFVSAFFMASFAVVFYALLLQMVFMAENYVSDIMGLEDYIFEFKT
jgi:hypothetical protein